MDSLKTIPLSGGSAFALVDDEDFDRLAGFAWHLSSEGYVRRSGPCRYMHQDIMGDTTKARPVDHVNFDKLDNRRANLRRCTQTQNLAHRRKQKGYGGRAVSSSHKGVCQIKSGRWMACIGVARKRHYLGYFATEAEAAEAYRKAAVHHFGEFAHFD